LLLLEKTLRFKPTASETSLSPVETRKHQLRHDLLQSRALTLSLFEAVDADTFTHQAHPDFSPVGWHLGHIGFTEGLWLLEPGATETSSDYRRLFVADGLPKNQRTQLPPFAEICQYLEAVRTRVFDRLETAPLAEEEWLWRWLIQHESQHCETISWVLQLQRSPTPAWGGPLPSQVANADPFASDMVRVEAGPFEQGNDSLDALDNERSVHTVNLPTFWLDRFLVTQGQYQSFIEAGGYRDPRWWSAAGWRWLQEHPVSHPLYWRPSAADHPVCGLSWYEADAYARFVGKRLPTEAEWEKAASWNPATAQRQRYPWGSASPTPQHGNYGHGLGQTTPVQAYPLGQSPVGCYDLLGNVWEWTDTWFHPYPGFQSYPYAGYSRAYFDQQHRVLKGGSWATCLPVIRSAFRNWYHPATRQHFAGFRCAHSEDA